MNPILEQIKKRLDSDALPDLRALATFVRAKLESVDVMDWQEFKILLMEKYQLTELQLDERLMAPVYTKDGGYVDDFTPLMQKHKYSGFLRRYTDHLVHTESPAAYHFASALTVLGAALKRQVWFDQKIFKIWPAVQTLIIGPSGKTHKSTAANYAIQVGEESGRIHRMADEITPQDLSRELSDLTQKEGEACALIYSSELSTLLGKQDYNEGLIQKLTDLFDSRLKYKKSTKTAGTDVIRNIAISFLACSNEGWASYSIPTSAISGGWMGRILTFFQSGSDKDIPFPTLPDAGEYSRLVSILNMTQYLHGEFKCSEESVAWFRAKSARLKKYWPDDEAIDPFWSRYRDHLLRIGMLFRASDMIEEGYRTQKAISDMSMVIEVADFEKADALVQWIMRYLPRVYHFLGVNKYGEESARIVAYISRKGGACAENELARAMSRRMSKKQLTEYMSTLMDNFIIGRRTLPPPHIDGMHEVFLRRKIEEM